MNGCTILRAMNHAELLGKQEVVTKLQAKGITPTTQRVTIGQVLFARPQHVSAEQVLDMVNTEGSHVSKATVYNTLNLFARSGLVREVIVDPTKIFYDSNTRPHHRMFAMDTGVLSDLPSDQFQVLGMPDLPDGTSVVGLDVVLRVRSSD
ncbi:MAG: transcriptional repressor [Gammaproteobacteria bacterium]|nr:transcriptional repressor [Gammaproteobacteria bacterium]